MFENKLVKVIFLSLSLVLCFAFPSVASSEGDHLEKEQKFDVGEMIMHHVQDAHEWHLWGDELEGKSIYLPIILSDNGLKSFSSYYFYHGTKVHVRDAKGNEIHYMSGIGPAAGYALFHEKIYKLDDKGKLNFEDGHATNSKPLDLSITKNVVSLIIGSILLLIIMLSMAKFYKKNGAVAPKGIAKFIEPFVITIRDDIAKENINHNKYHKYVPYLLTIFFFIWINNLLGLVPIFPGGANLTGNITVTFFLALCTLMLTLLSSNKNYWKHIFATPGVPVALMPIMIPIEIVGIFTKPFALTIRLFANITAGHIIILALISIIFINKNVAWSALSVPMALFISCLEMLVAVLQAYLFALLSALFIGAAVEEAHH